MRNNISRLIIDISKSYSIYFKFIMSPTISCLTTKQNIIIFSTFTAKIKKFEEEKNQCNSRLNSRVLFLQSCMHYVIFQTFIQLL